MFNFFSNQGYGNTGNYKIIHQRSCGAACRAMTLFCISEVLYSLGFRKLSPAVGFHMLCREGNQNLNKRTTAIIIIIKKILCPLSLLREQDIFISKFGTWCMQDFFQREAICSLVHAKLVTVTILWSCRWKQMLCSPYGKKETSS